MAKDSENKKMNYIISEETKHEGVEIVIVTKRIGKPEKYKNAAQAYRIFQSILNFEEYDLHDKEHFWVMGIDNAGYIVCIYIVALGGTNQVNMTAAEVLDFAVGLKSRKIILAHNHPSGDVRPSKNDILTTNRLYHVSLPFGIEIIDHLIISLKKYYSLAKMEIMEKIRNDDKFKSYIEGQDEGMEEGEKIGIQKGVVKGRKEGNIEGLNKGIIKGKKEGLKEGKIEGEHNKAVEMAKSMLADNMDIKIISKHTGLSKKEIEKLR